MHQLKLLGAALLVGMSVLSWWFYPVNPRDVQVQVSNCDDACVLLLNGGEVLRVGFGQQSRWLDLTALLRPGENELRLQVVNYTGAIAYGLKVVKGGRLVVNERCGEVFRVGCDDDKAQPQGIAIEIIHRIRR